MRLIKRLPSGTIDEVLEITRPDEHGPGRAVWSQRVHGTTRLEPVREETIRTQALYETRIRNARIAQWKEET